MTTSRRDRLSPPDRDEAWIAADDTQRFSRVSARRGLPLKRILLLMLLAVLAIAIVGGVLLWQRVSAFNAEVSTAPAMSSALWGPLGGDERVNVVMIGYAGRAKHGGTYLGDSINILSIDPETDTTTVIPVPRDFWIEGIPEMPGNGKINQAFALGFGKGGMPEAGAVTARVLSEVTGLQIDHWMAIDFDGFKEMVDAVGGVTVTNRHAFRYTMNDARRQAGDWVGRFKRGELTLNGKQALTYARVRFTDDPAESSDFARSVRQQKILSALRSKLGSGGIGSFGPGLSLMDALGGRLHTDLSAIDLFLLSSHFHPDRRLELKEDEILQATRNTSGEYILVVIGRQSASDYTPLRDFIANGLAQPDPSPSSRGG
jgi:LCP family protein required for cell wall assembly